MGRGGPDTLTMTRDNVYYSVHVGYEFHERVKHAPMLKRTSEKKSLSEAKRFVSTGRTAPSAS